MQVIVMVKGRGQTSRRFRRFEFKRVLYLDFSPSSWLLGAMLSSVWLMGFGTLK
jgi:hypothetical protein